MRWAPDELDLSAGPPAGALPGVLRVSAYNLERGRRLDAIVARWHESAARHSDVVLVSEADRGMARSANRYVARELAERLGYQAWAYAPEFHELTKGDRRERRLPGENREARHGNAILARFALAEVAVIRLPAFFDYRERFLAREGSRIALVADIGAHGARVSVASTHLEAVSSPRERALQMRTVIEAMAKRDRGQPLVIGGDMNTTGLDVRRLWRSLGRRPWAPLAPPRLAGLERREPLFGLLAESGYEYRRANLDEATLRDRGYRAHLDWLFVKNVAPEALSNSVVYREFAPRRRYSDHLPIGVEIRLTR